MKVKSFNDVKVVTLNETLSRKELDKLWKEELWIANRPRTWYEWFCWAFDGRYNIFNRNGENHG